MKSVFTEMLKKSIEAYIFYGLKGFIMKATRTSDAVEILKHHVAQNPELAALVEEERRRLKIADKIHEARLRAGLSQKELAKRIGATQSSIARLETGEYERLTESTLLKASLVLNCHLNLELEPTI